MTAHARLLELRRSLVFALAARAILIGTTVGMLLLIVARGLVAPAWAALAIFVIATGVALGQLLKVRPLRSLPNVALWVEERTPSLRYALVTVADGVQSPSLELQALGVPWWTDARRAVLRSLVLPAVTVVGVLALSTVSGSAWREIARVAGVAGSGPASERGGNVDVLATVHVEVSPPAYARRARTALDDPTNIEALVGSAIVVSGRGDARLLTATVDSANRSVAPRANGWSLSFSMPARPAIMRLHSSAGRDRLVVLAPIADAAPAVTLMLPARDTIVREAKGYLALRAQVRDDIGLADASFEIVVSSGGGENFTFRTTRIAHTRLDGVLERLLDARVSLDSLALQPGDIVQMRAVARDGNSVTGPGIGSSETRALRVARAGEYDSVAIEQLPPPEVEGQVLSQRMLINLTEALVKRQRSLTRAVLVDESRRLASDQAKLRKRVGDVVFQRLGAEPLSEDAPDNMPQGKLTPEDILRMADSVTGTGEEEMHLEGDETPILAVNKPLLEAFNAMWDAGRALEVGEPAKALPPMRRALAAIERARQAERIYLRGKPGTVIVDIAKVRLSGKDKGTASIREARTVVDPISRRWNATFERVTAMLTTNPDAAADSLLLMRVEALGNAPALALALDVAATALRKRDNAAIGLAWSQLRRALGGAPVQRAGVGAWSGIGAR